MTAGKSVLLVEDEAAVRDLETRILVKAGYSVEEARDGASALKAISKRRPDLVLLDLHLPGTDGWKVLEQIETQPAPPPVVIVSGMYDGVPPGHLDGCVAGYVCKPFSVEGLVKACEAAISTRPLSPASGDRCEARRNFRAETIVMDGDGRPMLRTHIVQLSQKGFRIELHLPLEPGDVVRIACHVPGRDAPLQIDGRVRWRKDGVVGAQIEHVSPGDLDVLRRLVDDNPPD